MWLKSADRLTGIALVVAMAIAVGACTSAEEAMNDGIELEAKGAYDEAAWKYIRALRKDDQLIEARERLQWVIDTLIVNHLARANESTRLGRYVAAADAFSTIDRLTEGAFDVGVAASLPDDYALRRRDILDRAIESFEEQAATYRASRKYSDASELLREAVDRFDPEPATRDRLLIARFDVLLMWADDLFARASYREAVRRTDEALAIAETIALDPSRAMQLRAAAMEAGTVYVAATPVWRSSRLGRDVSPAFLADLNDRLEIDYWSTPPEFIVFAHPALVRRRLRQLDLDRESLSNREARIIARDLDADFAVVAEIDRFEVIEKDLHQRPKQARTRAGLNVVYYEVEGRVEIRGRLSYAIVDSRGNRIKEDEFEERRSTDFKRAEYDADYRDLDISRSARTLFDSDRYEESVERVEGELARRFAERFGRQVFDQILNRVR